VLKVGVVKDLVWTVGRHRHAGEDVQRGRPVQEFVEAEIYRRERMLSMGMIEDLIYPIRGYRTGSKDVDTPTVIYS